MAGARPKQGNVSKDKCWKDFLSSLQEKTCAEDKLRSMRTKLFIIEDNFYCTRRCMVEKIDTQEVKVDLLILQTKMYCDAYETTCRGESSSESEDGAVGCCINIFNIFSHI